MTVNHKSARSLDSEDEKLFNTRPVCSAHFLSVFGRRERREVKAKATSNEGAYISKRPNGILAFNEGFPSAAAQNKAQVAQSVEQRTENPRVGGSIPPLGTIFNFYIY